MNKTIKIALAVGIACCLFGGILHGIGRYTGGENYVRNTDMDSFDGEEKREVIKLDKKKLEDFERIEVNFEDLDLVIKPSDDDSCYLSYRLFKRKRKNPLACEVKGDTLRLEETGAGASFYVQVDLNFLTHMGEWDENADIVTLYVPEEKMIEDCSLAIGDGDLLVEKLKSKNVTLKLNSGDMILEKSDFDVCKILDEDGDIHISESLCKELQINSHSGDVLLRDMELPKLTARIEDGDFDAKEITVSGETEIKSSCGDVSVYFADDSGEDTEIMARTESGDLSVEKSLKGTRKSDEYGDVSEYEQNVEKAAGHLNIKCSDGDIILR